MTATHAAAVLRPFRLLAGLLLGLVAGCAGAPRENPDGVGEAGVADAAIGPWRTLGHSVEGRPIRVRAIGHGPRRVLWVGGIHGNETEGALATERLPDAFLAAGLEDAVTLTILEDLNPDGRANNTRGNANGVDLNRNYPAGNFDATNPKYGGAPLSQPEARVMHDLVLSLEPDLVIVAHSWSGRTFINPDGPAVGLARRFSELSGYPLVLSDSFNPTPGSLGSWVGRKMQIPILTLEYLWGKSPERCWRETREAILAVIAGEESSA